PVASRTSDQPKPAPASPKGQNVAGHNPIRWRRFWLVIFVLLLVNIIVSTIVQSANQTPSAAIPYNGFVDQVNAGKVINLPATGDSITGTARKAVSAGPGQPSAKDFSTERPSFASDDLEAALITNNVSNLAEPPNPPTPWWETLLFSFGPTLLIVFGFIYLMRRGAAMAGGGAGGLLGRFGQSGARLYDPEHPDTTFADVAGIDEVKAELVEIVDFLKKPEKYQRLGGTIPKGVLLIGAPVPSPARRRCRSSRSQHPNSSRRSWESAQPGSGISFRRHAARLRRSSSSTSSTPSAAHARRVLAWEATRSRSRPSTRSSPRWTASIRTRA